MKTSKSNTVQALWIGMGSFSSFALSIISAAILSRYFDKTEYGTYRQIIYIYNTLLVIFSAGLPRVFSYYLPRYSLANGKDIVLKISKVLFSAGFIFSIFLYLFSGLIATILKNPELETGLKYFSPVPMFLLPTLGIEGIFSTYKKTIYVAIYNTLSRLLMLLFIVLPVIVLQGDYLYAIYGWLVVSIITFFIAFYFKGIPFKGVKIEKSSLKLKEIFKYSIPLLIASLGGIAIKSADQFYISRYFGAETFAEFSNGFMELPFIGMITFSIASILMPQFSKMIHEKSNTHEIIQLWQSALMKSAMLIYPLVLFFLFYASEVITILFSQEYIASTIYFRIALIANFFNVIMFAPLLLSMGETKFYSRLHVVFAVIAWVGGYITILITNSPIALAIFSVSKAILLTLIAFYYTSKLIKVSFFQLFPIKKLFILLIHAGLSLVIVRFTIQLVFNKSNNLLAMAVFFISFIIILLATAKLFKLNYLEIIQPLLLKVKKTLKI